MSMSVTFRPGKPDDAEACATICYEAFKEIAAQHNFPPDFPSSEIAVGFLRAIFARNDIYSIVAEIDGRIVGSNFLTEYALIAGVGPITVHPHTQNSSIGRQLMESVLSRARTQRFAGVRLVQATYHNRSLSLYTKLGFDTREPLSVMQGPPLNLTLPGCHVRQAVESDLGACNRLCWLVHGHERSQEVLDAIRQGTATVVDRGGRLSGYATSIGYFGHAVGETNEDLKALIGEAPAFLGPGFLLPTRNADLFRWCLQHGLRVVQPLTLMSLGLYQKPSGAALPSIFY
jgi:predicted N-acetyltransferase YhbS